MNWRISLYIFLVAAVLSIFNMLDYMRISRDKDLAARRDLIITLPANKVGFIAIERKDSNVVCMKDKVGSWRIVDPVKDYADIDMVKDMLAFVSFGRGDVVNNVSSQAAGIDNSSVRMGVSLSRGKVGQSIIFGNLTSDKKYIYAAREFKEDVIYKIEYDLVSFLFKDASMYRDRSMFSNNLANSQKIILNGTPSGEIIFTRTSSGWIIEKPVSWPADNAVIQKILRKAVEMRSLGIMAENPGDLTDLGFGKDSVSISFVTPEKISVLRLAPGLDTKSQKGISFKEGRKPVFFVNDQMRKDLSRHHVSFYRNKRLDLLKSLEKRLPEKDEKGKVLNAQQKVARIMQGIKEISILKKESRIRLLNEKIFWREVSPESFVADTNTVFNLIAELRELKVSSFLSKDEIKDKKLKKNAFTPHIELAVTGNSGKYISKIKVGRKAGSRNYYAKTDESVEIFKVSSAFVKLLERKWYKYHQKAICFFDLNDVITLKISFNGKTFLYKRASGDAWQMVEPETRPADAWALYTGPFSKKNGIGGLIALDIIGEVKDDLSIFGLKNPSLHVECTYKVPDFAKPYIAETTRVIALSIGKTIKVSGRKVSYAKLKKGKVIFLIPGHIVEGLKMDFSVRE